MLGLPRFSLVSRGFLSTIVLSRASSFPWSRGFFFAWSLPTIVLSRASSFRAPVSSLSPSFPPFPSALWSLGVLLSPPLPLFCSLVLGFVPWSPRFFACDCGLKVFFACSRGVFCLRKCCRVLLLPALLFLPCLPLCLPPFPLFRVLRAPVSLVPRVSFFFVPGFLSPDKSPCPDFCLCPRISV